MANKTKSSVIFQTMANIFAHYSSLPWVKLAHLLQIMMKTSHITPSSNRVIRCLCLLRLNSMTEHARQSIVVGRRGVETTTVAMLGAKGVGGTFVVDWFHDTLWLGHVSTGSRRVEVAFLIVTGVEWVWWWSVLAVSSDTGAGEVDRAWTTVILEFA